MILDSWISLYGLVIYRPDFRELYEPRHVVSTLYGLFL